MKNNKILGLVAWALGLALSLFLIFLVPKDLTRTIYAVAVCTVLVYLFHLTLWMVLQKGKVEFNNLPSLTLSILSLMVQTIWAIIVAFAVAVISVKMVLLINILLIVIQAFAIVLALVSKNHIESVGSRQKDHHVKL